MTLDLPPSRQFSFLNLNSGKTSEPPKRAAVRSTDTKIQSETGQNLHSSSSSAANWSFYCFTFDSRKKEGAFSGVQAPSRRRRRHFVFLFGFLSFEPDGQSASNLLYTFRKQLVLQVFWRIRTRFFLQPYQESALPPPPPFFRTSVCLTPNQGPHVCFPSACWTDQNLPSHIKFEHFSPTNCPWTEWIVITLTLVSVTFRYMQTCCSSGPHRDTTIFPVCVWFIVGILQGRLGGRVGGNISSDVFLFFSLTATRFWPWRAAVDVF